MKKVVVAVLFLIVILAIIVLLKGCGLGFGTGVGTGDGEGKAPEAAVSQETTKQVSNTDSLNDDEKSLPNRITVTIKEDKVFVEEMQIEDAESLKDYIEEINTDTREYFLKDENSILDTYDWVTGVFEELKIVLNSVE